MKYLIIALLSYLLGSFPFGYYIGKYAYKKDIRTMGSGNIGTTNALRNFGKIAGLATFALDFLKGFIACLIGNKIAGTNGMTIAMLFVVLGHMYSFILKFKGGKGIATVFGALVYINPTFALCMFGVFLVIVLISRMVSLGSVCVCLVAIVVSLIKFGFTYFSISLSILAIIIVIKHRTNIKRIINGKESKLF